MTHTAGLKTAEENLRHNGFQVVSFAEGKLAAAWLSQQVPEHAVAAFGGSVTLRQIGLAERLAAKHVELLDHWQEGLSAEDKTALLHRAFSADAYFCSVNACTLDGFLLNIDGSGNRIAASVYGPKHVYFVIGRNKLAKDLPAAMARAEEAAVANAKRLGMATPCVEQGVCSDCRAAQRICRAYMLIKRPVLGVKTTVVLIDEDLGY